MRVSFKSHIAVSSHKYTYVDRRSLVPTRLYTPLRGRVDDREAVLQFMRFKSQTRLSD